MKNKRIMAVGILIVLVVIAFCISYYWAKEDLKKEDGNIELVTDENILPPVTVEKVSENQIGGNTQYVFDIYNRTSQTHAEQTVAMPPECIGMTREEFITYLSEYEKNPSAEEKQKGFCDCSLLSFSGDKVVVRKIYEDKEVFAYILKAEQDNRIGVYEGANSELFMLTDIYMDNLPEEMQTKCKEGYGVKEVKELYDFLENYSS